MGRWSSGFLKHHPLREIRKLTDVVLRSLSGKFDELYAATGRVFDCAGVHSAGTTVAGILLSALGAAVV